MPEYTEVGTGEPLVMLHGAPTTPSSLESYVDAFSDERRVVLPELYGLGQTADAVLPALIATLRRAGADGAPILGHSFGAYRAFQLAVSSVFEVGRIAAVGPLAVQPDERLEEFEALATRMETIEDAVEVAEGTWFSPVYRESHDAAGRIREWFGEVGLDGIVSCLQIEMHGPDLRPALSEVEVPVRLVVGEDDGATPVEWAREMHELIPESELFVIQNSGHFPDLESPEQTFPILEDFFG